jgi:hypothetical protein
MPTIAEIIDIAKLSQAIASFDKGRSFMQGQRPDPQTPKRIYMERKAVEWRYQNESPLINPGTASTATITIGSVLNPFDVIVVNVLDMQGVSFYLGEYQVQPSDTTTALIASGLVAELQNNDFGFRINRTGSVITITALADSYASFNGSTLIVEVEGSIITTEDGIALTTEDGRLLTT